MSSWVGGPGPQGPQGPAGPAGPPGTPIVALSTTTVTINTSNVENDLATIIIPANTLAIGNALRFRFFGSILNNTGGGAVTFTYRFKWGTSIIATALSPNFPTSTSHDRSWSADILLLAESLTAQRATGIFIHNQASTQLDWGLSTATPTSTFARVGGTENLAAPVTAKLTSQCNNATVQAECQLFGYMVEKLAA